MYRYIIFVIIAGIIGGVIAFRKGHNPISWFVLCTIVPLLIFVIMILPDKEVKGYSKKCRFCSEVIKEDAIVCRYCGNVQ